jgi:hypothetical protein
MTNCREPGTENWEERTGKRELETGNRKQGTGTEDGKL